MATIYPRPVFNYTLPEEFYQPSHSRPGGHHFRPPPPPNYEEAVPRSVTINPQQLYRTLPLSPPMDTYEAPPGSYPPTVLQRHMTDRDQMDYMPTSASSDRRSSSDMAPLLSGRHRTSSYSLDMTSSPGGRRPSSPSSSPTSPNDLLTPPHSPLSTVPSYPPARLSVSIGFPAFSTSINATSGSSSGAATTASAPRFYCPHPNCQDATTKTPTKSFSRRADLQRHHACTHQLSGPLFSCPKHNCQRKGDNGFTRMDHLIEHRRGYHGENIPKRGTRGSVSGKSGRSRSGSGSGSGSGSDRERRRS